ncbi:phoD-like phosphatase family protein [Rhodococcus sp. MTM3W5.2]|nr:phoD-like phosphatase family protein [Rhodococcus sp. MTM3W5.2]
MCLGDYVYEFTKPGVRGFSTNVFPQTIDAMRDKYRQYRTDENLRQMHSQHAFIPIWDDHEFRNNYSKDGWTSPVVADIDSAIGFQQKKQWAWQSWFEHMPVPRFAGDPTRTYRSLRVGKTVELFAPDTRQYRDRQPCGDTDATACAVTEATGRTMLGAAQKRWLLDGMTRSDARWKVVANANMMMGMVVADDGARGYLDTWDGYGAERTEILSTAAQSVENLVLVTGDDHDGWGASCGIPGSRRARRAVPRSMRPAPAGRGSSSSFRRSLLATQEMVRAAPLGRAPRRRAGAPRTRTSSTPTWSATATGFSRSTRPRRASSSGPSTS